MGSGGPPGPVPHDGLGLEELVERLLAAVCAASLDELATGATLRQLLVP